LRGIDHPLIDSGQGGGFSDSTGDPVDHPDLLGIHIAALIGLPHRRQARS
jgi:hypothetical protein